MTERMEQNGYKRLLWSMAAAGMSVLAAGCGSMPDVVSRPIEAVRQLPSKLVRAGDSDAELKRQAEKDPFPTRSEAAAQMATRVQ